MCLEKLIIAEIERRTMKQIEQERVNNKTNLQIKNMQVKRRSIIEKLEQQEKLYMRSRV